MMMRCYCSRLKVAIEHQCALNENSIDIIIKAKEDDTIEQLVNLVSKCL